jgi:diguanylate cyclase (GGDEF)-like protein/PAS domain S-box-containing protein
VHEGVVDGAVGVFIDVTDRTVAEQALGASEAHLRGVLDAVREALVVLDENGCITSCNDRFRALFGPALQPGDHLADVLEAETAAALDREVHDVAGGAHRRELRLVDRFGHPLWVLVSTSPQHGPDGTRLGSVVILTDITAQKEAERRLVIAARTDPVTGVANRSILTDRLDQALARRGGVVAVLFCDVDDLKAVNDEHGHAAGDALLRHVAQRIRSAVRPADTIVRYGGDEFVVVCDGLPDPAEATGLAERTRQAVSRPVDLAHGGPTVVPTVSIGVATSPPRPTASELVAAADTAAYAAKAAGRDAVHVDE